MKGEWQSIAISKITFLGYKYFLFKELLKNVLSCPIDIDRVVFLHGYYSCLLKLEIEVRSDFKPSLRDLHFTPKRHILSSFLVFVELKQLTILVNFLS